MWQSVEARSCSGEEALNPGHQAHSYAAAYAQSRCTAGNAMSPSETQEQRLAAKRQKMPRELADLHWHLEDELTLLHLSWNEYEMLFATNQKRVDLLNTTAPKFFVHFEDLAWRETLLHLCRLTDPPKSTGKNTLTVLRLPSMIDDAKLKAKVEQETAEAKQATEFAQNWRNRRIAHRSLEHALNPQLKPLATARRGC
jgi:hypothetical protein